MLGRSKWGDEASPRKTDGYTQMVSAFCSHTFGFGLQLNEEELKQLNERRKNDEWGTFISSKEAFEINGTDKKRW